MSRIRPFVRADIEQVARLHNSVFEGGHAPTKGGLSPALLQEYADYFEHVLFGNPWFDEALPSLVSQDGDGKISGFLGVLPRRMLYEGTPVKVALSSQFVVDPSRRASGAGVRLLKAFLSGPQDLSVTDEANNTSRALWQGLGGSTAYLYCLHWTCVFRPARYGSLRLKHRGVLSLLTRPSQPFAMLADQILSRLMPNRLRPQAPDVVSQELDLDTWVRCLQESSLTRSLWPDYDRRSLQWLIEVIARLQTAGELRRVLIRHPQGEILGWYVYQFQPREVSVVLQLVAKAKAIQDVLGHLLHDARRGGSVAVAGRLEPHSMPALSDRKCLCTCGAPWLLIHAREPELMRAVQIGDVLLSSLEGEMCMRFK